jgi:hypothetical protein
VFAFALFAAALSLSNPPAAGFLRIVAGYCNDRAPAHPRPRPELAAKTEHDRCRVFRPVSTPLVRPVAASRGSWPHVATVGHPRIRRPDLSLWATVGANVAARPDRIRREPLRIPVNPPNPQKNAAPARPEPVSQHFQAVPVPQCGRKRRKRAVKSAVGTQEPAKVGPVAEVAEFVTAPLPHLTRPSDRIGAIRPPPGVLP